jgi:hypothetical protein
VPFEAVEPHCLDCESPLSVGEGPNAASRYDFAAREIAAALAAVANGATYSQAALGARRSLYAITEGHDSGERSYEERARPGPPSIWGETWRDIKRGVELIPCRHTPEVEGRPLQRTSRLIRLVPRPATIALKS